MRFWKMFKKTDTNICFTRTLLPQHFELVYFQKRESGLILLLLCFIKIPVNANSVGPDQMLHSVASDLGLHFLPMTLLRIS